MSILKDYRGVPGSVISMERGFVVYILEILAVDKEISPDVLVEKHTDYL